MKNLAGKYCIVTDAGWVTGQTIYASGGVTCS